MANYSFQISTQFTLFRRKKLDIFDSNFCFYNNNYYYYIYLHIYLYFI